MAVSGSDHVTGTRIGVLKMLQDTGSTQPLHPCPQTQCVLRFWGCLLWGWGFPHHNFFPKQYLKRGNSLSMEDSFNWKWNSNFSLPLICAWVQTAFYKHLEFGCIWGQFHMASEKSFLYPETPLQGIFKPFLQRIRTLEHFKAQGSRIAWETPGAVFLPLWNRWVILLDIKNILKNPPHTQTHPEAHD